MSDYFLELKDFSVNFPIYKGIVLKRVVGHIKAVDHVSFGLKRGETFGLVGESGCGKTTTSLGILQMYRKYASGDVLLDGTNLTELKGEDLRRMRRRMQIIFQDPYSSLNPRMTVGNIIGEPIDAHNIAKGTEKYRMVKELLEIVGLNPDYIKRYPHQFSGGQRQRIGIARALALKPDLIVCDEPISALDVSIQAQILNLLDDLQKKFSITYLMITHDMSVVRHVTDTIGVMYLGNLIELCSNQELYSNPLHPYTKALLSAVPIADPDGKDSYKPIFLKGFLPNPAHPPKGCPFCTRCQYVEDVCMVEKPQLKLVPHTEGNHQVACHLVERGVFT